MSPLPFVKSVSPKELNHDIYNNQMHHFLREVTTTTDIPDEVTEILNEIGTTGSTTTDELLTVTSSTIEQVVSTVTTMTDVTSGTAEIIKDDTLADTTLDYTSITDGLEHSITDAIEHSITDAIEHDSESSESSQTILIVLGVLLAVLVIVCCVLACIFAKMRRKGFCTVEGKNQATCDDDCQEDVMSMQQSPKESMASEKSETSRSSDKLLTK